MTIILTTMTKRLVATLLAIICLTGCNLSAQETSIPLSDIPDISETAETLNISVADFETFLSNIDTTYSEYMTGLNTSKQTLVEMKANIETKYKCTFKNYVDTVAAINNTDVPSEDTYVGYKSQYNTYDAYFPKNIIDIETGKLKINGATVMLAEDADNTYAFDILTLCNNDFRLYFDKIAEKYKCDFVEISTVTIFGSYGTTKPDESNPCMEHFFVYEDETGLLLDKFHLSLLSLCYKDNSKNITLALSDELGLLFETTGINSKDDMLKLKDLKIQVRKANHTTKGK